MLTEICLLDCALAELFAQVSNSGHITVADRYGLLAALLNSELLSDEEQYSIDRLLRAVRKGRIKIVNDLSVIR